MTTPLNASAKEFEFQSTTPKSKTNDQDSETEGTIPHGTLTKTTVCDDCTYPRHKHGNSVLPNICWLDARGHWLCRVHFLSKVATTELKRVKHREKHGATYPAELVANELQAKHASQPSYKLEKSEERPPTTADQLTLNTLPYPRLIRGPPPDKRRSSSSSSSSMPTASTTLKETAQPFHPAAATAAGGGTSLKIIHTPTGTWTVPQYPPPQPVVTVTVTPPPPQSQAVMIPNRLTAPPHLPPSVVAARIYRDSQSSAMENSALGQLQQLAPGLDMSSFPPEVRAAIEHLTKEQQQQQQQLKYQRQQQQESIQQQELSQAACYPIAIPNRAQRRAAMHAKRPPLPFASSFLQHLERRMRYLTAEQEAESWQHVEELRDDDIDRIKRQIFVNKQLAVMNEEILNTEERNRILKRQISALKAEAAVQRYAEQQESEQQESVQRYAEQQESPATAHATRDHKEERQHSTYSIASFPESKQTSTATNFGISDAGSGEFSMWDGGSADFSTTAANAAAW